MQTCTHSNCTSREIRYTETKEKTVLGGMTCFKVLFFFHLAPCTYVERYVPSFLNCEDFIAGNVEMLKAAIDSVAESVGGWPQSTRNTP